MKDYFWNKFHSTDQVSVIRVSIQKGLIITGGSTDREQWLSFAVGSDMGVGLGLRKG